MQSLSAKHFIPIPLIVFLVSVAGCDVTARVVTPISIEPSALSATISIIDNIQNHSALVAVHLSVKDDTSQILQLDTQESLSESACLHCDKVVLKWDAQNEDYQAPASTSPTKDSSVTRSSNLRVSYQAPSAYQVQVDASDDAGTFIPGSPKNNTGEASIDTNSLAEGLGTLRLVADYNIKPVNIDFSSVQANYKMIVGTSVIWVQG